MTTVGLALSGVALAFALMTGLAGADDSALTGDQILARAARADGLGSYSVPLTFQVHLLRPIGARARVGAIAYFKAPAQSALATTEAPPPIGNFFKGSYAIDMVPQAWATKYRVGAVTTANADGVATYVLQALPVPAGPIDRVVFHIAQSDFAPLSAEWTYHDRSSIRLTFVNQHIGVYILPQTATIAVDMPGYALEADASYGTYALNATFPEAVFPAK